MPFTNAIVPLLLLYLAVTAAAAATPADRVVVMNFPPPLIQNTKTRFEPGEDVKFRWTSNVPWISLELYQVSGDYGSWAMIPLLTNTSNATTFYIWTARELEGMNREDHFHLRLFNAHDPNCRHCHSNSSEFMIIDPSATSKQSFKLGVGLGLGLGVPVLVTLTAFMTWLWVRRRRHNTQDNGSQLGEPLVDWKGAQPSVSPGKRLSAEIQPGGTLETDPSLPKVEIEGRGVVEMPVETARVEALGIARAELEGDVRQAG